MPPTVPRLHQPQAVPEKKRNVVCVVAMSGVCLSGASQWDRKRFGASAGTFRLCVFPISRNDR